MAKSVAVYYDPEGDILDVFIGKTQKGAIYEELTDDFLIRKDRRTGQVTGFMMMNFMHRLAEKGNIKSPVEFPPKQIKVLGK